MLARGTRRRRCSAGAHDAKCAWCKHMGAAVDACTWEPRGQQSQFVVGAGVAGACFGHMVAAVWGGSAVRQQNKDRLERDLGLSVAGCETGAAAPPQPACAAALLGACKLHQVRSRRSCSSSESSNSDHLTSLASTSNI